MPAKKKEPKLTEVELQTVLDLSKKFDRANAEFKAAHAELRTAYKLIDDRYDTDLSNGRTTVDTDGTMHTQDAA